MRSRVASRGAFARAALCSVFLGGCLLQDPVPPDYGRFALPVLRQLEERGWARVFVELRAEKDEGPAAQPGELRAPDFKRSLDVLEQSLAQAQEDRRWIIFEAIPFVSLLIFPEDVSVLQGLDEVVSVTPDPVLKPTGSARSFAGFAVPAAPVLQQSIPQIGADVLHEDGIDGADQAVVIIDTGVDDTHSYFSGRVVGGSFYTVDEDHDCDGAIQNWCRGPLGDATRGRPLAADPGGGHGTDVATIACGTSATEKGVAPAAQVISIRVTDSTGVAQTSDIVRALEEVGGFWRKHFEIAAINVSLGEEGVGYPSGESCMTLYPAMTACVEILHAMGIPVVVSSGNDWFEDMLIFPACLPRVVSVGAVDKMDVRGDYSNAADWLDLMAPGSDLIVKYKGIAIGTSNAAPHVSGAFALLRQSLPGTGYEEILDAFTATGVPIPQKLVADRPRIQVDAALALLATPTP